jgi:hypothetical protein
MLVETHLDAVRTTCVPHCMTMCHACSRVCRYLTTDEALSYIAHSERNFNHTASLTSLLQSCIDSLPLHVPASQVPASQSQPGESALNTEFQASLSGASRVTGSEAPVATASPPGDPVRRRYLTLIAQKGAQLLKGAQKEAAPSSAALAEAWALLSIAATEFRRCAPADTCFVPVD